MGTDKKAILLCGFFVFLVFPFSGCAQDKKADLVLETDSGRICFFVHYIDAEEKICDRFYGVFEKDISQKNPNHLVTLEKDVIRDASGLVLLDFSKHLPTFWGVKINLSYPKNTRFTPGINLDPYFGSSMNVGDTQRIQWDRRAQTFQKNPSIVP